MTPSSNLAALYIHGLAEAWKEPETQRNIGDNISPFAPFSLIEHYATALGFTPQQCAMPLDGLEKALLRSSRLPLLADHLNTRFDPEHSEQGRCIAGCQGWVLFVHSAGVPAFYKWVEDHGAMFDPLPIATFAFDGPHKLSRSPGPRRPGILSGSRDYVNIRALPMLYAQQEAISAVLSGASNQPRLHIFRAGDDVFIDEEVLFDAGHAASAGIVNHQFDVVGHNGICSHDDVLRVIVEELKQIRRTMTGTASSGDIPGFDPAAAPIL